MIRPPPRSTLFPSTPLFRSRRRRRHCRHRKYCPPHRGRNEAFRRYHAGRERNRLHCSLHERFASRRLHPQDRKSTRLNSSHLVISYAVFCLKKKITNFVSANREMNISIDDTVPQKYFSELAAQSSCVKKKYDGITDAAALPAELSVNSLPQT